MSREEILRGVAECIATSLAIDLDEIEEDSRLIDDLGADSLDLVDMIFMIEERLQVNLRDTDLSVLARLDFSSPEVLQDGVLTPAVIDSLKPWLPALSEVPDERRVTPSELFSFITVGSFCIVIHKQMAAREAAG